MRTFGYMRTFGSIEGKAERTGWEGQEFDSRRPAMTTAIATTEKRVLPAWPKDALRITFATFKVVA